MKKTDRQLITLLSAAVNGTVPDCGNITEDELSAIWSKAEFHSVSCAAAYALESAGVFDKRFAEGKARAIRKNLILDNERASVVSALEKTGVWYMPLKGVVLKDHYPKIGMRQMTDNDILIDPDRAADVRTIMEGLGFRCVSFGTKHQDEYQKPPVSNFEMHRMLFTDRSDERLYRYYRNVNDKLLSGSGFERRFGNEDFYIYMIAHEYKHYCWSGTGVRSLLDVYVFLNKFGSTLDRDYIRSELNKLGISEFEKKNRSLAEKVFGRDADLDALDPGETEMLGRFLSAGTYGTEEQRIQNGVKKTGKAAYIKKRVFLPMNAVKANYPFFYKHKLLLPVLPAYRLFKKWGRAKKELGIVLKSRRT